ncbi:MAG: DUF4838 domain-containing protein [Kiritimatiellae bacterium]|nr:DUF4838 domain-containing protein [Kiritimatiellia bacterium]
MKMLGQVMGVTVCLLAAGCEMGQKAGTGASGPAAPLFKIVEDGKAAVSLIAPVKGEPAFEKAVAGFTNALKAVTGVALPVSADAAGRVIRWQPIPNTNLMNEDEYSITFPDARTLLIKASPVSLQWAFNHILETAADVRYLFPEKCGMAYRAMSDVSLPRADVRKSTSFPLLRSVYVLPSIAPQWSFKASGIKQNHELTVVAFPAATYNRTGWPEEIMPVHKGKRITKLPHENAACHWQPCYSNPRTAEIAAANILKYLREHPDTPSIGLGINDNGGFCECENCAQANGAEGRGRNKSEVYFKWVNRVAEAVAKEFPHVYFGLLAYSQTYIPPSFSLHKNVVPVLTIDLYSCVDPDVMAKHKKTIAEWSAKASVLGVWDYCWGNKYYLPRVYFTLHAEMLKFLHDHHCRAYFAENEFVNAMDGPKMYLVSRLMQDITADPSAILDDWYVRCVGRAAAPHLKAYFDACEAFYRSPEIKRTPWYTSRNSVYMSYYDFSWMNAMKPGGLDAFRQPLEQAVRLASTPSEKARAERILLHFAYAEARMRLCGAEALSPEGGVASAPQALALLREFAGAGPTLEKWREVSEALLASEFGGLYQSQKLVNRGDDGALLLVTPLIAAASFLHDPAVLAAFREIGDNRGLPGMVRGTARTLAAPGKAVNHFPNPGFENKPSAGGDPSVPPRCTRTSEAVCKGDYALKVAPGISANLMWRQSVKPGNYLVTANVYMRAVNPEAYLDLTAWPMKNGVSLHFANLQKHAISGGVWQNIAAFCAMRPDADGLQIMLRLGNFDPGEALYIDDVTITEVAPVSE